MNFMVKCCECNRVRLENNWLPEYEAVKSNKTIFSHSYCPDCLRKIMAQLEAWSPAPEREAEALPAALDLHQAVGG